MIYFLFNAIEIIRMLIENYKYNQHVKNEIVQQTTDTSTLLNFIHVQFK